MFTRCTHCDALFRVTLHQLQSSSGQVRCGECLEVFDAFVHLSASAPGGSPVAEPVAPAADFAEVRPPVDAPVIEPPLQLEDDSPAAAPMPEPTPEPVVPPLAAWAEPAATAESVPAEMPVPHSVEPAPSEGLDDEGFVFDREEAALAPATSPVDDLDFRMETPAEVDAPTQLGSTEVEAASSAAEVPEPGPFAETGPFDSVPAASAAFPLPVEDVQPGPPPIRRRILAWALVVLLVVALPLQAVVFLRNELAQSIPALRPALVAACLPLGCKMPLPKLTDRLVIEASELQALDPTRPHRVVLIATIRNGAALAQAYPFVELTLTDAREQVSGRRVFSPQEYLPTGTAVEAGLAPDSDVDIRLNLDTGSVDANGYRLFVYHP